jgi:aspartyl-tRNA(Asn)/glutamyl-tRNA(Gln) amidotransferase subunit C
MTKNKITKEDIEKIAELTNFKLSKEDIARFAEMFTDTIKYMDILNELDTTGVTETYQVTGLTNVFQEEDTKPTTLHQDAAIRNGNEVEDNLFVTKAVFER